MKQLGLRQSRPSWNRIFPWKFIRLGFGALLLLAAFLKFQNLGLSGSLVLELMPQIEWLAIQLELLVGLWLISGWWGNTSRVVLLVLLSAFFGASLMMVVQGRSTCGCLGAASVSPIWMLVFDFFAILIVASSSPAVSEDDRSSQESVQVTRLRLTRPVLALTIAAASVFGALFISLSPAIASKLAQFSGYGQTLSFDSAIIDVGNGVAGEWRTIPIRLYNNGDNPVRLVGGKDGCSCRTLHSLPLTVSPRDHVDFQVSVKLGTTPGVQNSSFWLLTDCRNQGTLLCRWKAVVVPPPENIADNSFN